MQRIKIFIKAKKYYLVLVAVLALLVSNFVGGGEKKQLYTVSRMDITEEVAATGKVKAREEVSLGFNASGRVSGVYFQIGDKVEKGKVIAKLDTSALEADLLKAKSALDKEIALLQSENSVAPVTYENAVNNLITSISKSWDSADNAIRNKADQFFKNPSENPRFEVKIEDGNYIQYFNVDTATALEVNNMRSQVEKILNHWQNKTFDTSSRASLIVEADKAISDLRLVSTFLTKVAQLVNSFIPSDYDYESTVNGYKTLIGGARNDVSIALSDIVTAKDKLNNSPLSSDNTFVEIEVQQSEVAQARSEVRRIESQIEDRAIRAPFSGIVTIQDAKVGSSISGGEMMIQLLSDSSLYVEANISEINIGKLQEGDVVKVDFDAFPGEEYLGEIFYIEPGAVIVDGVVNYKIQIELYEIDEKIKSGLTTNIKIITAEEKNVLAVPIYALQKNGDKSTASKVEDKERVVTNVELGKSGNSGFVEVVSGLEEGDVIEF